MDYDFDFDFDLDVCDACGSHRCPTCEEMTCFGCSCDDEEEGADEALEE
jgi:hypothetical protein